MPLHSMGLDAMWRSCGSQMRSGLTGRRRFGSRAEPGLDRSKGAAKSLEHQGLAVDHEAMPLLERDQALAALTDYARDVVGGAGRFVAVAGEAGVGKSSLLARFQRDTSELRWASAACDGLFTPRPLGPLFELAEQLGGDLLEACRRGASRDELFALLLQQLGAGKAPVALAIEDVHWADEATLDLLRFLGRRLGTVAAMIVVTYRDDDLRPDAPLRVVLGALAADRVTRRVALPVLSVGAVAALAADSGLDPAELYRLTGGNPFLVTEVVGAGSTDIPASARDVVLSRLAGLSVGARAAVEITALAGDPIEPELLAAAGDVSLHDLDELVEAGVLVGTVGALRFRHEITRMAVRAEVPVHRRTSLSAALLRALRSAGSNDDARLADHADQAGDQDAVLFHAPRAGARAAHLGAHREAAEQYQRGLRHAVGDVDTAVVAELNDRLALECSLIDSWKRAAEAGEAALVAWRLVGDPLRVGETLRALSRAMWWRCRGGEALAYAEEAVATVEPLGDTAELVWAYAHLAAIRMHRGEREVAFAAADQAARLAPRFGLADVVDDGLSTEPCFARARAEDWHLVLRSSLRKAKEEGVHQQAARVYANLAAMMRASKELVECEAVVAEGVAYCAEHDIAAFGTRLQATLAQLLLDTGRWDEAVRASLRVLDNGGSPRNTITPALVIGSVLARRGDVAAWPHLDAAVGCADGADEPDVRSQTRLARAEAYWLSDDLETAAVEVALAATSADEVDDWTRGLMASWQRRLGGEITVRTDRLPDPYRTSLADDAPGAARLWEALGCPYDAALAWVDSGSAEGLNQAQRRFETLGATAAARATRREMRSRGMRPVRSGPHAQTLAHPAGLTRREHEVLRLLCAQLSNAEISQELVISQRTVDHHVSSVLAKLGVSSRRAAATEAVRLGLVDSRKQRPVR
jgi:DNA-binding CsgD family transcriptional regulator/tetratricopeptide (TPR) repeat protein